MRLKSLRCTTLALVVAVPSMACTTHPTEATNKESSSEVALSLETLRDLVGLRRQVREERAERERTRERDRERDRPTESVECVLPDSSSLKSVSTDPPTFPNGQKLNVRVALQLPSKKICPFRLLLRNAGSAVGSTSTSPQDGGGPLTLNVTDYKFQSQHLCSSIVAVSVADSSVQRVLSDQLCALPTSSLPKSWKLGVRAGS